MNMSSTGKFFKIVGLSTVIALAGGVYTSSALETSYTVQQDAIPELYTENKYKYEESMKAHIKYFKEPRLLKSDYITALDNYETMVNNLSNFLPYGRVNDTSEQVIKLKIELMDLESFKHDITCLRNGIDKITYTADGAEYVELTNSINHNIALRLEKELFEFYRR